MSTCPESPIWLEWKGHTKAAWRAKGQLQGQNPPALPQVTNLGATHFGDVEKQETTTFVEEGDGATVPLRGAGEEVFSSSEAGSSHLVRPPWLAPTAAQPLTALLREPAVLHKGKATATCAISTAKLYSSLLAGPGQTVPHKQPSVTSLLHAATLLLLQTLLLLT
jgi:hypothetical protein